MRGSHLPGCNGTLKRATACSPHPSPAPAEPPGEQISCGVHTPLAKAGDVTDVRPARCQWRPAPSVTPPPVRHNTRARRHSRPTTTRRTGALSMARPAHSASPPPGRHKSPTRRRCTLTTARRRANQIAAVREPACDSTTRRQLLTRYNLVQL